MTKVPTSLLPDTISVEPYLGSSAVGPTFDDARTIRARVEGRRKAVRTSAGVDVIGSATATIRPPSFDLPAESKVTTADGKTYTVLEVVVGAGLRRPAYHDLILDGPR